MTKATAFIHASGWGIVITEPGLVPIRPAERFASFYAAYLWCTDTLKLDPTAHLPEWARVNALKGLEDYLKAQKFEDLPLFAAEQMEMQVL